MPVSSKDTIILAGCAKYRYNKADLGDIGGIPRVLTQVSNDSCPLAVIALKLKEVFGLDDVNKPDCLNIAWYEQKAVVMLRSYIWDLRTSTRTDSPGFLSPSCEGVVDKFGSRVSGPWIDIACSWLKTRDKM